MDQNTSRFLAEHLRLSRRHLLSLGVAGYAALRASPILADEVASDEMELLQSEIDNLEPWLTKPDDFQDVSRGNPKPHTLDEATRTKVGLTPETWKLEVVSDTDHPTRLRNPLTREENSAFTFNDLMKLAKTHAVKFPKVMTCLNLGCPLGNGIWEGVPLREVLWLTQPTSDLRRVFYYGYHNDEPEQMFRSSLPVGRILEDLYDLPPVILCYKLNGQWLTLERGGPVRVVVPEAYGFKNIKWLSHVVLSNQWKANDTYGEKNNDVDSPLKTFCEALTFPTELHAKQPFAVTGYAQVGVSGLSKVQVWLHNDAEDLPDDDRYFTQAPWRDVHILAPPEDWGGGLPGGRIPEGTRGFDPRTGQPSSWPLPLSKAHWAGIVPGVPAGQYTLRCRTVDGNGVAQPMPRPYRKSGRAAIQEIRLTVKA